MSFCIRIQKTTLQLHAEISITRSCGGVKVEFHDLFKHQKYDKAYTLRLVSG